MKGEITTDTTELLRIVRNYDNYMSRNLKILLKWTNFWKNIIYQN